ncbi:hypothetical protein T08_7491 [Trichinella sp. T8]|nr:hypothetical protein T08_7491 [Trichinella sp. T8]
MSGTTPLELWHVPFSEHWAVFDKNVRHRTQILVQVGGNTSTQGFMLDFISDDVKFPRTACSRTLHFVHIFLVFHPHTLQRPCVPVPRICFASSNQMSENCNITPDAAIGGAAHSDCSKLRTTCLQSSRCLCGLSSTKQ